MKPLGEGRSKYEKDFRKNYSKNEIEEINMRNLFYKTKLKGIVDSNLYLYNQNNNNNNNNNINSVKKENIEDFNKINIELFLFSFFKLS